MSQMDISIAAAAADHSEAESLSDEDDINHNISNNNNMNQNQTYAEHELVGTVDSLEHNQQLPVLTPRSSNIGYLERCGRWLMAIPRDDVVALQQTSEYREFLAAFDKLGEAHRRTVTLEKQHLVDSEEDNDDSNEVIPSTSITSKRNIQQHKPSNINHPLSPSSALRRRRYSFLQHLAMDDVLLRIFEFIDCSSLIHTGSTCDRFRRLTNRSAEQRIHRLSHGRLLRSAMMLLRAQEQIEGVGEREGGGPFVQIPMLGLSRRVQVKNSGDPDFNGVYFCTGCNGNGFLFTKPRNPERRVLNRPQTFNMRQLADGIDNNENQNAVGVVGLIDNNEDGAAGGQRQDTAVDVLYGDEPNRSRLLRCVIAKRFSNETILWYMSKEVEDETTNEISQNFCFWAKLLVTGDATPNVCQYPSTTGVLSRNGDPAWQCLTNTMNIEAPVVELLDG